ncbi:CaiB/BaiF CoA-transferase family protein [Oceanicola sp. 502str15]|uniref:CaiB/BaiF CoA transferase family protein n=1 Tax=Oceanicola sp. 502str15 TaxID=2696061 RepID=UPI002094F230|nr:CaiB/BaiF CoA-transferase family protein [Oceanicola sp. 502str15]MCO6385293.1 CoA transferase [Oceanicola sp. 502str15]
MGPLEGIRIVEFGAIGPGPLCAMLLADMGAEIIRLDRTGPSGLGVKKEARFDITRRSRPSVAVDLKHPEGRQIARDLIASADALIEGFRPGVMERLGLGPEECANLNSRIVYGRMTGWGQDGPLAQSVGHDINYLAMSGALGLIGRKGRPPAIPLNLIADYGAGALYLSMGLLAAIINARSTGQGQVVDAAILDGLTSLLANTYGYHAAGRWKPELESNVVDGGAPFYNVYETADAQHIAVGAIEPKFYRDMLKGMGLDEADLPPQNDESRWEETSALFAEVFRSHTRAEWERRMHGLNACFSPVLSLEEAMKTPQIATRNGFVDLDGVPHAAPAPRFSRTASAIGSPPPAEGADTVAALSGWGISQGRIDALISSGVLGSSAIATEQEEKDQT